MCLYASLRYSGNHNLDPKVTERTCVRVDAFIYARIFQEHGMEAGNID